MSEFKGFGSDEDFFPLPETFLTEVLPAMREAAAIKAALYALWRLIRQSGHLPLLPEASFLQPEALQASGLTAEEMQTGLQEALSRQILLSLESGGGRFYLLNSPRGRALLAAFQSGEWQPDPDAAPPHPLPRPNIYRLYEENIGPLTPLIADALRDAENEYSPEWVAEALNEAVKRNVRNWKYAEAILKRWKEEGHDSQEDRRDAQKTRYRHLKGKFADYIDS